MREWVETHGIALAVGLVAGVAAAFAAGSFARAPAPAIEVRPRVLPPTPTAAVYVHVEGAVGAPGVYQLGAEARVFEAIDAAGGAREDADLAALNLAARVADGQKLMVPARAPPGELPSGSPTVAAQPTSPPNPEARINLNTATQRMLESLPGIGQVTARRILDYRQANGPFRSVEQLREARLVNTATYERIKDLVTV